MDTSIWFVPVIISVFAVILAFAMLELDRWIEQLQWQWLQALRIGADGVRQVLTVTTSATMTITGVVFSVTVVTLTLASNQLGPKILRNYLRDTGNKVVLGLFVGAFLYGLLVLASIDTQQEFFVPTLSVFISLDMLNRALDAGIPVLGICRGAQLLNVGLGGTLHQDTRPIYKNSAQRTSIFPVHRITVENGSLLSALIKTTFCRVNNLHHQAVDRCGRGLVAVAHDEHGIIEGIESLSDDFTLSVQWHPEYMPYRSVQRTLFSEFVIAARKSNRQLKH